MSNKVMRLVLTMAFLSLLTACGGGGNDGNFVAGQGTSNARYNGQWGVGCEYNANIMEADVYSLSIDGTTATIDFETYSTSDCGGLPSHTGQIVYDLDFVGTQAPSTGVCEIDDKVNTRIISAKVNGISLPQSQINQLHQDSSEEGGFPQYTLFCVNAAGDTLYFYDEDSGEGTTEATRPNHIDDTEFISRKG